MLGPFLPQALDALTVVVVVVMGIGVCFKHIKQVKRGGVGGVDPRDEVTPVKTCADRNMTKDYKSKII